MYYYKKNVKKIRKNFIIQIFFLKLNLCLPNRALRLTEASLPTVLSHGSVQAKGRALLLLARCRLSAGKNHRVINLQQTLSILSLSQDLLRKAKDFVRVKHCFYLKVRNLDSQIKIIK